MKSKLAVPFFLALAAFALGVRTVHAMGSIPPPVPATPNGFVVELTPGYLAARWQPVDGASNVLLAFDGVTMIGINSDGVIQGTYAIDLTLPHHFTLQAINISGKSAPAIYDYVPPSATIAEYEFVNASSSFPIVNAFMTFNPTHGGQRYVNAALPPGRSQPGQIELHMDDSYLIYAKGFISDNSAGTDCDAPLIVQAEKLGWPPGKIVVATYRHAEDPKLFGCTLSLQ